MNASSIAPTLSASLSPSNAPRAAASMTLRGGSSITLSIPMWLPEDDSSSSTRSSPAAAARRSSWRTLSPPSVSGVCVSGTIIFAMSSPPGAAMKAAAIRYSNCAPRSEYPTSTEPATLARPPLMMAKSSERVIRSTNGRTTRGASVWPTKMFAEADMDSAWLVPRAFWIAPPRMRMIHCKIPR